MRRRRLQLVVGVVAVLSLIGASLALADWGHGKKDSQIRVKLIGYNEVPPINTAAKADLKLNVSDTSIGFTLTYSNLSGPPTMAHIHVGQKGVNGDPVIFFCGPGHAACPATTSGTISGTLTAADVVGSVRQGFPAGQLGPLLAAMRAGVTYANMHTATFPTGEIRGQIRGKHGDDDDH
jgi:hypothetical protein